MSKPTLKVSSDFTKQFNDIIKKFRHDSVLVGIPEDDDGRKENQGEDGQIGNAALLAINEFGSPMNNIPPRPVMSIGIRNAQEEIAAQFKLCAQNTLSAVIKGGSGFDALDIYYNRAGLIASNSVKKAINSQEGIDGPSEATLASRKSRGFKGVKALIVTGQMRNAITYVLRGG
jgi:hypothetical protein